jgi:hypothetical protein
VRVLVNGLHQKDGRVVSTSILNNDPSDLLNGRQDSLGASSFLTIPSALTTGGAMTANRQQLLVGPSIMDQQMSSNNTSKVMRLSPSPEESNNKPFNHEVGSTDNPVISSQFQSIDPNFNATSKDMVRNLVIIL